MDCIDRVLYQTLAISSSLVSKHHMAVQRIVSYGPEHRGCLAVRAGLALLEVPGENEIQLNLHYMTLLLQKNIQIRTFFEG